MVQSQSSCLGIYIALGSNLPFEKLSPLQIIKHAVELMPAYDLTVVRASSVYETPPFPAADQPNFVNAIVKISTQKNANTVLEACLDIERMFDRERVTRWGARTLDLDVIAVKDAVMPNCEEWLHMSEQNDVVCDDLVLPHPRMHKRAFVLLPLRDVAPAWVHPVLQQSIDTMIDDIAIDVSDMGIRKISEKLL